MTKRDQHSFCDELGCSSIQELCARAQRWNREISQDHHVVRSCILELHAVVEAMLKHVLFHQLLLLIEDIEEYHEENESHIAALTDSVKRLSCGTLVQLLHPCLVAWGDDIMAPLPAINRVRNAVAHRKPEDALYKGRCPFTEPDALAELIHDVGLVTSEMGEFCVQKFGFGHPETIERMNR